MSDKEETSDASETHDNSASAKKNGRTSLLDSGEDFEMLDEEYIDDDPPPLEDTGAGKDRGTEESLRRTDANLEPAGQVGEWLDILGNDQLKKKVLTAGEGQDSRPVKGQSVRVSLKTSLMDGTLVEDWTAVSFTLGDGDVIQALDLAVQLMEMGEKAVIQTEAKYAYGPFGSLEPLISPDVALSLEVELLEAADSPDLELLPPKDKILLAIQKRERGNVHFQRGDYAFAVNSYSIAQQITESSSKVDITPEEEAELLDVKVKCLNNMAASQLKLDHFDAALKSCVSALACQPDNIKALFRKGKVLALQNEYTEAIQTMRMALKLEPSSKTIHAELSKLVKKNTKQKGAEQAMYKKMLGNPMSSKTFEPKQEAKTSVSFSWKWIFGATAVAIGGIALSVIVAARN